MNLTSQRFVNGYTIAIKTWMTTQSPWIPCKYLSTILLTYGKKTRLLKLIQMMMNLLGRSDGRKGWALEEHFLEARSKGHHQAHATILLHPPPRPKKKPVRHVHSQILTMRLFVRCATQFSYECSCIEQIILNK